MTGKAKFEVARNAMLLSPRLKAEFQDAVNAFTTSVEYAERVKSESETQKESEVLNMWYARRRRLQPLSVDLRRFVELGWESEIVLGLDAHAYVSETVALFRKQYGELSSAIDSYFDIKRQEAISGELDHEQEWLRELKRVIYQHPNSDFLKEIDDSTTKLASALKAYVK